VAVRILEEQLINKIAAGEVVERPASVVKELVENALDAGATSLQVHLKAGGRNLVRVVDDGVGMNRTDALMCLERHATSKILNEDDLFSVSTLGFRGEAVPSIASVSRFEILTRPRDAEVGTRVVVEGGRLMDVSPAGAAPGTEISAASLFFNLPARRKFLRSVETELGHCMEAVTREALIRPTLDLEVTHDDRPLLRCAPSPSRARRAADLLGAHGEALVPVSFARGDIEVEALVSPVGVHRASPQGSSWLYVNGRFVRDPVLRRAVTAAYAGIVPKDRYPLVIVEVRVPPSEVDVNVHPAKTEVRFANALALQAAVTEGLRAALREHGIRRPVQAEVRSEPRQPAGGAQVGLLQRSPLGSPSTGLAAALPRGPERAAVAPVPRVAAVAPIPAPRAPAERVPVAPSSEKPAHDAEPRHLPTPPRLREDKPAPVHADALPTLVADAPGEPASVAPGADGVAATGLGPELPAPEARAPEGGTPLEVPSSQASPAPIDLGAVPMDRAEDPPPPTHDELPVGADDSLPPNSLLPVPRFRDLRVIGQLATTYVLCEGAGELVVIDQHAAHERVTLYRLTRDARAALGGAQRLLVPVVVQLPAGRARLLAAQLDRLAPYGLDLSDLGGGTFAIQAVPAALAGADLRTLVADVADELAEGGGASAAEERLQLALATRACHSSVRAGQVLSDQEMRALLASLDEVDFSVCAHGRPVALRIGAGELERRFHRS
jgi:DNA mismatch repair protein MutL